MKKIASLIFLIIILGLAVFFYYRSKHGATIEYKNPASQQVDNTPMTISSPAFADGQSIPDKYSCNDQGINPPLEFSNVPKETVSLAFILDDPDAPNGTWTHWLMWNIDPATTTIAENSVPTGAVQGQASSGQNAYGGPCPPSGTHHYHFKLFALSAKLKIPSFSDVTVLNQAMNGLIISQAEMVGTYSKQ